MTTLQRLVLIALLAFLAHHVPHGGVHAPAPGCPAPSGEDTAALKIYPPIGVADIFGALDSNSSYNRIVGRCYNCTSGATKYFYANQPNAVNANNADMFPSVDVACVNQTRMCLKSKSGGLFKLKGLDVHYVSIYTICDSIDCSNYVQLFCDLTNFQFSSGLYNRDSGKARWTCENQQGRSGTQTSPTVGRANHYLKVVGASCDGCGKLLSAPCTGPVL